jgi:hypothetical protein
VSAGRIPWLVPVLGGAALVVLTTGLALRYSPAIAWGIAVLGAEYAVWLTLDVDSLNTRAPLVGAGLLLASELAYASLEPEIGRPEPEIFLRRLAVLAGLVLGATAVGVLAIAVAAAPLSGGVGLTAGGVVAAVVALALIARLAAGRVTRE